jgi:hypothetical protein
LGLQLLEPLGYGFQGEEAVGTHLKFSEVCKLEKFLGKVRKENFLAQTSPETLAFSSLGEVFPEIAPIKFLDNLTRKGKDQKTIPEGNLPAPELKLLAPELGLGKVEIGLLC